MGLIWKTMLILFTKNSKFFFGVVSSHHHKEKLLNTSEVGKFLVLKFVYIKSLCQAKTISNFCISSSRQCWEIFIDETFFSSWGMQEFWSNDVEKACHLREKDTSLAHYLRIIELLIFRKEFTEKKFVVSPKPIS